MYHDAQITFLHRLEAEGRASELLDVPQLFDKDLSAWLESPAAAPRRARLAWLHQLRVANYGSASATLSALPQAGNSRCCPLPRCMFAKQSVQLSHCTAPEEVR